jgi:hypothetical protein
VRCVQILPSLMRRRCLLGLLAAAAGVPVARHPPRRRQQGGGVRHCHAWLRNATARHRAFWRVCVLPVVCACWRAVSPSRCSDAPQPGQPAGACWCAGALVCVCVLTLSARDASARLCTRTSARIIRAAGAAVHCACDPRASSVCGVTEKAPSMPAHLCLTHQVADTTLRKTH